MPKFKNPDTVLDVPMYGRVDQSNLTQKVVDHLIAQNPINKDLFEEEPATEKKSSKTKSVSNETEA